MKLPALLSVLCALGLALLPAAAQAQGQPAVTAKQVNLRAGPARDYPLVAMVQGGYPISVLGCIEDYRWCDVLAGDLRGWVYAGNISYSYQGNYVPLAEYAPLIGIGILGFVINDYWGSHYRHRPFYRERDRWSHFRPPPPRPRPPEWNRPDRPGGRPDWNRPGRPDRPGSQLPPGASVRPVPPQRPPVQPPAPIFRPQVQPPQQQAVPARPERHPQLRQQGQPEGRDRGNQRGDRGDRGDRDDRGGPGRQRN